MPDSIPSCTARRRPGCAGWRAGLGGLLWSLATGLLLLGSPEPSRAAEASLPEYQVKALFLFNFAKYVEWPAEAFSGTNTPITIGIVGASTCGQYLQKAVDGKIVAGRPILVRQVERPEDLVLCQILFISDAERKRLGELLGRVRDRPGLTVGESEHFAEQGGMIGFVMKEGKVRLVIELKAARQANLQISSKLLSVADTVIGKQ